MTNNESSNSISQPETQTRDDTQVNNNNKRAIMEQEGESIPDEFEDLAASFEKALEEGKETIEQFFEKRSEENDWPKLDIQQEKIKLEGSLDNIVQSTLDDMEGKHHEISTHDDDDTPSNVTDKNNQQTAEQHASAV